MKKELIVLSICFAMLIGIFPTISTNAQNLADVIISEPDDKLYVPAEGVTDKESYFEMIDEMNLASTSGQASRTSGYYYISDQNSAYRNGSEMYSKFSSTIDWDYIESSKVSGTSRAAWLGANPVNCTNITLTDKITFAGLVVSVNASGGNWSTSLQSATWSATQANVWSLDHSYNNVTCIGLDLYIKQSTIGDFQFGTQYYTTTASDSQFL